MLDADLTNFTGKKTGKGKGKGKKKGQAAADAVVLAPPAPAEGKAKPVPDAKHLEAVEKLQAECMKVSYEIPWLTLSKTASTNAKSKMTAAVKGKSKGYTISKRLFASDHEAVQELNNRRREIDLFRQQFTTVMVAKRRKKADDKADAAEGPEPQADDAKGKRAKREKEKVAAGLWLIRREDIDEFDKGFEDRVAALFEQVKAVQAALPEIKELDKDRLGEGYDDADYPDDVASQVSVAGPFYDEFTVSTRLPPQIYERQVTEIQMEVNGHLGKAVDNITGILTDAFATWIAQLCNRQRIHPKPGSGYEKYANWELYETLRPGPDDEEEDFPEGTVILNLHSQVKDPKTKKSKTLEELVGPVPEADVVEVFRPLSVPERRRLHNSSAEKVLTWLANFANVKPMLGPYGEQMEEKLSEVRTMLAKLNKLAQQTGQGTGAEGITEVVRTADMYREDLVSTLNTAIGGLKAVTVEAGKAKRRLSSKLVGKL